MIITVKNISTDITVIIIQNNIAIIYGGITAEDIGLGGITAEDIN